MEITCLYAAKAGANNEGHGHLDVGVFVLYINDHPVFLDPRGSVLYQGHV